MTVPPAEFEDASVFICPTLERHWTERIPLETWCFASLIRWVPSSATPQRVPQVSFSTAVLLASLASLNRARL